ncbi:MAG: DUF2267 domain-containing protein [Chloroflexota bacterium]
MADNTRLDEYYQYVQQKGKLRTDAHAKRWSDGILKTLGLNMDRGAKKALARALPDELANSLTRVFWLLHFRNENLSREEFQKTSARRSGNTDADFAYYPIVAVFGGLKQLIDADLQRQVADSLAPGIRELWDES